MPERQPCSVGHPESSRNDVYHPPWFAVGDHICYASDLLSVLSSECVIPRLSAVPTTIQSGHTGIGPCGNATRRSPMKPSWPRHARARAETKSNCGSSARTLPGKAQRCLLEKLLIPCDLHALHCFPAPFGDPSAGTHHFRMPLLTACCWEIISIVYTFIVPATMHEPLAKPHPNHFITTKVLRKHPDTPRGGCTLQILSSKSEA